MPIFTALWSNVLPWKFIEFLLLFGLLKGFAMTERVRFVSILKGLQLTLLWGRGWFCSKAFDSNTCSYSPVWMTLPLRGFKVNSRFLLLSCMPLSTALTFSLGRGKGSFSKKFYIFYEICVDDGLFLLLLDLCSRKLRAAWSKPWWFLIFWRFTQFRWAWAVTRGLTGLPWFCVTNTMFWEDGLLLDEFVTFVEKVPWLVRKDRCSLTFCNCVLGNIILIWIIS